MWRISIDGGKAQQRQKKMAASKQSNGRIKY
jgi:hypothetical protein